MRAMINDKCIDNNTTTNKKKKRRSNRKHKHNSPASGIYLWKSMFKLNVYVLYFCELYHVNLRLCDLKYACEWGESRLLELVTRLSFSITYGNTKWYILFT